MDANNDNHSGLAELLRKVHEIALKEEEDELREVEEETDRKVANLFGLSEDEVEEVTEALRVVYGKVVGGEEEVEEKAAEVKREEASRGRALEGLVKRFKEGE